MTALPTWMRVFLKPLIEADATPAGLLDAVRCASSFRLSVKEKSVSERPATVLQTGASAASDAPGVLGGECEGSV